MNITYNIDFVFFNDILPQSYFKKGGAFLVKTSVIIFLIFVLFILVVSIACSAHIRHGYNNNGKIEEAWFIELPGWGTAYYPEDTITADNWLGSKIDGLDVTTADGKKNPEAEALIALKATGHFKDYELKQQDKHWILYRPAKEEKFFTFQAFYRVSHWFPCK